VPDRPVNAGSSRRPDTPADLRTGRLTRCANRPSKAAGRGIRILSNNWSEAYGSLQPWRGAIEAVGVGYGDSHDEGFEHCAQPSRAAKDSIYQDGLLSPPPSRRYLYIDSNL
jgi:hypothetical protein